MTLFFSSSRSLIIFSQLLRHNWHLTLCKFNMYNVMIWYMYILASDYHNKSVISITSHTYKVCVCAVGTLKIYSWQLSNIQHSIVNDSHWATHHIPELITHNWKLVLPSLHIDWVEHPRLYYGINRCRNQCLSSKWHKFNLKEIVFLVKQPVHFMS